MSSKKVKNTKTGFWGTRILHAFEWNSGSLNYSELSKILHKDEKAEYFAKTAGMYKTLNILLDEEVQIIVKQSCPKSRRRQKVLIELPIPTQEKVHFAERTAKRSGKWTIHHLTLQFLNF